MKTFSLFVFIGMLLYSQELAAQFNCQQYSTDSGELSICFHRNRQRSTIMHHSNGRFKEIHFTAYNQQGKLIYEKQYSNAWGHGHIETRYYASGALLSAHFSFQPDGGIQHTDINTYFFEDGSFDREEDYSLGNNGTPELKIPKGRQQPAYNKTTESMPCQEISSSDIFIINASGKNISVHAQYIWGSAQPFELQMKKGDTLKLGVFYPAAVSDNPLRYYKLKAKGKGLKPADFLLVPMLYEGYMRYNVLLMRKPD